MKHDEKSRTVKVDDIYFNWEQSVFKILFIYLNRTVHKHDEKWLSRCTWFIYLNRGNSDEIFIYDNREQRMY
jgi:hypothetical protein